MMRWRRQDRAARLAAGFLLLLGAGAPGTAVAHAGPGVVAAIGPPPAAAADAAPVVGAVVRWLGFGEAPAAALRPALEAFEGGRFEEAASRARAITAAGEPAYAADDARFLEALALRRLGHDAAAAGRLREVVDAAEPGPYVVPALLELVEIAERADRDEEVAALWLRYVDRPLRERDERSERVRELFFEFGTLRAPRRELSRDERRRLSKPEELEVVLGKRRERAGDRLAYRAGLALQRLGRYRESLEAFQLVGLTSPYWPYARYSIAQDLYALGESRSALRELRRLERYPAPTPDETLLRGRTRLLRAAMTIDGGELEEGIALATAVMPPDPAAVRARLLVAEALVAAGKPALAVVYDAEGRDPRSAPVGPMLAAARSLALGSAYASLGDLAAAERVVRSAASEVRASQTGEAAIARAVARLADRAERYVAGRLERERREREHVAEAIAEIVSHDGPWSFRTMLRRLRAALGAGAHVRIARGVRAEPVEVPAGDELWLAYLRSPRREIVEDALARLGVSIAPENAEQTRRLRARVTEELRSIVRERDAELGRLSLELEVALADTLAGQAGEAPVAAEVR